MSGYEDLDLPLHPDTAEEELRDAGFDTVLGAGDFPFKFHFADGKGFCVVPVADGAAYAVGVQTEGDHDYDSDEYIRHLFGSFADQAAVDILELLDEEYDYDVPQELVQRLTIEVEEPIEVIQHDPEGLPDD